MSNNNMLNNLFNNTKYYFSGAAPLRKLFLFGQVGFYIISALLWFIFYEILSIPIIGFVGIIFDFIFVVIYPIIFINAWWKSSLLNYKNNPYLPRLYIIIFLIIHIVTSGCAIFAGFIAYSNQYDYFTAIRNDIFKEVDFNKFNKEKSLSEYCHKRCCNFGSSLTFESDCIQENQNQSTKYICLKLCESDFKLQLPFWAEIMCKKRCDY